MEATKKKRRDVDDFIANVKAKRKSWRDVIAVHPAADLFPMMSESELRELGEDIRANGLQTTICVYSDASKFFLLDGRNRLDAMELVGVPFKLTYRETSDHKDWLIGVPLLNDTQYHFAHEVHGDPYDLVLSLNVHRLHLTNEQKRELVAKVIKAKPELSDRQIATKTGTSPTTVGKVRDNLEGAGMVSKLDTVVGKDWVEQPRLKAVSGKAPEVEADESDTEGDRSDTPEQRWQYSLSYLAGDAISLPAFWTREFGDWESFEATSDLVTLAEQAAEAWTKDRGTPQGFQIMRTARTPLRDFRAASLASTGPLGTGNTKPISLANNRI